MPDLRVLFSVLFLRASVVLGSRPSTARVPEVADDLPCGQAVLLPGLRQVVDDERQALAVPGVGEDAAVQRPVWQPPCRRCRRLPGRRRRAGGGSGQLETVATKESDLVGNAAVVDVGVRP